MVSVIIPVYQVELYIKQCLISVLEQTYTDIEIILIDDGSKDSSGDICDQYARNDDRIKVIHKQNGGLMSAWLAGLEIATKDYLFFVDSDDWIEPDAIEKMVDVAKQTNADIVCCNYWVEYKNGRFGDSHTVKPGYYNKDDIRKYILPGIINDGTYLSRSIRVCRWGKLIKKTSLTPYVKYCNPLITVGEDMNIMLPTIINADSIYIMDNSFFFHYRMNEESIMKKMSPTMWKKVEILHKTILEILSDFPVDSLYRQEIIDYCDLAVMVVGKELRQFSKKRDNLYSIYQADDYHLITKNIDLKRYNGVDRKAAKVIISHNKINYYWCKGTVLYMVVFDTIKNQLKKMLRKK